MSLPNRNKIKTLGKIKRNDKNSKGKTKKLKFYFIASETNKEEAEAEVEARRCVGAQTESPKADEMAEPKKKSTRAGRGYRYYQAQKRPIILTACPKCHQLKPPHLVCPVCGFYKGKVLTQPEKPKKKKSRTK